MKEREIDLIDLFVEILLHWRVFIVWMLVGAILLGAYSFAHSRNNNIKDQQAQTLPPEEWLSEEEIQNVDYAIAYERIYQEKLTYLEKAPLMNINSTHVSKAEATIGISAEEPEKNRAIKKMYEDILQSSELITYVSENTGIEAIGLDEIILLAPDSISSDILILNNISNITANESSTSSIRIIVKYNDKAQCQDILDTIIAFLKDKQSIIENTFGEYEFIIIDSSVGIVSDKEIAEKQKTVLNDINVMKKTISDMKTAFSDSEQQYYALLNDDSETDQEQVSTSEAVPSPGISIKYVFLGAIIAAFLYALWLFIIYIFNTKIRYTDNLQELCDIPQFGLIPAPENNKKIFGFIDKWLLSLRNHGKRQFTPEEALDLASVAVKMSAGKEALTEISIIGCGLKERSLNTCEKIKEQLAKDNIHINILNNVLYDAQAMNELEAAKGVVLVESIGSTLYNELAEELELLKRQKIIILGGILIE